MTHLRLLEADSAATAAPTVGIGQTRARRELQWVLDRRLQEGIESLLQHSLGSLIPVDSFHGFGRPRLGYQEAWTRLESLRPLGYCVPEVPGPGESALDNARRLIAGAERLGVSRDRVLLWRTRLARLAGEKPLTFEVPGGDCLGWSALEYAADCAAARLDGGRLRKALDGLADWGDRVGTLAGRAELLNRWVHVLVELSQGSHLPDCAGRGTPVLARTMPSGASQSVALRDGLPRGLCELREEWPELLPSLPGAEVRGRRPIDPSSAMGTREELGAGVVVQVGFDSTATQLGRVQVPASLERHVAAWHRGRDRAWRSRGSCEQELLLKGRAVTRRLRGTAPNLEGALDPSSRSLALIPIPRVGCDQEYAGWVQVEYRHVLLPARERLESWGRGLMTSQETVVCQPSDGTQEADSDASDTDSAPAQQSLPLVHAGQTFTRLVDGLGMKLRKRRWWGFLVGVDGLVPAGSGGEGLGESAPGEGLALQRALNTAAVARFDESDRGLAQAQGAGSGFVVPVYWAGRVVALLALESERRRAFKTNDIDRVAQAIQVGALSWYLDSFAVWHRSHFGFDLAFASGGEAWAGLVERLIKVGRARVPCVLSGPIGVGKRILMRLMQFERALAERLPLQDSQEDLRVRPKEYPLGSIDVPSRQQVDEALQSGCAVFEGLPRWEGAAQRHLAAALEQHAHGQVLIHHTGSLAQSGKEGQIDPRLLRILAPVEVPVRCLCERRLELPELIHGLLTVLRERHGGAQLELDDAALGLLWRQEWEGGVPDLEGALLKLVLDAQGSFVGLSELQEILASHGVTYLDRLPSRRPRCADVQAALEYTRLDSGRSNKTRAAMYLGWDPDTLAARMEEFGLA